MKPEEQLKPEEVKSFFNGISLIYYLTIGIPMAVFIFLYLNANKEGIIVNSLEPGTYSFGELLLPLACTSLIPLSYVAYFSSLKNARVKEGLAEKLTGFSIAAYFQYGLLLLGTILSISGFYLTHEAVYIFVYCVIFFFQTVNRPQPEKVAKGLKLTKEEFFYLNQNRM